MELSKLQTQILNAPHNRIVVLSSAASGKTRLMTEKVRQLLRAGVNPKEIAVITFTNMAASELRQRLGEDYKDEWFHVAWKLEEMIAELTDIDEKMKKRKGKII